MKFAPTFKLINGVWHLTLFKDLRKNDIIRSFEDTDREIIDFRSLTKWICLEDPFLVDGPNGEKVFTVECEEYKKKKLSD